jgi:hypothetical protein
VNQHPHRYLHLFELGLLMDKFNPGNGKFELKTLI